MHQKANQMNADEGSAPHKTIHSGHFMISTLDVEGEDDDDIGVPLPSEGLPMMPRVGYDFESAAKTTSTKYNFQGLPKIIDTSLAKLFRAMTLAYSGQLTSPKFKTFKGMKLNLKDKLRLNNIIWREWHMQYIKLQRPVICSFTAVIDDVHQKPEAVVLEGKYWKRRLEIVCSEYKKWRVFFKEKMRPRSRILEIPELLERVAEHDAFRLVNNQFFVDPPPQLTDEDLRMDFTDTLFSSLNQPFHFPNPREMGQLGNADFIQPALIGLQPNLDDMNFMDTLDPLHEFLQDMPFAEMFNNNSACITNQTPVFKVGSELLFPCSVSSAAASVYTSVSPGASSTQGAALMAPPAVAPNSDENCSSYMYYATTDDLLAGYVPTSCMSLSNSSSQQPCVAGTNSTDDSSVRRSLRGQQVRFKTEEAARPRASPTETKKKAVANVAVVSDIHAATNAKPRSIAPAPRSVAAAASGSPASVTAQPLQQQTTAMAAAANTFLAQLLTTGNVLVSPTSSVLPPASSKADPLMVNSTVLAQYHPIRPTQAGAPPAATSPVGGARSSSFSGGTAAASGKQRQSRQASQPSCSPSAAAGAASPAATATNLQLSLPTHQMSLAEVSASHTLAGDPSFFLSEEGPSQLETITGESNKMSSKASPGKSDGGGGGKDVRRASHISAEQKRRGHIKSGFDVLHTLIPALSQNTNTKVSKAAMLQKTAEYCRKLKGERAQVQDETDQLKQEIEALNASIANCQSQLPATGAPVTRQRCDQMKEAFARYVQERTLQNWKFYILSKIADPLFDSFNSMVSTASLDELYRTSLSWLEQHGSLPALRPVVLEALRQLSRSTNILTDPSSFPKQAIEAVTEMQMKGSSR